MLLPLNSGHIVCFENKGALSHTRSLSLSHVFKFTSKQFSLPFIIMNFNDLDSDTDSNLDLSMSDIEIYDFTDSAEDHRRQLRRAKRETKKCDRCRVARSR